MLILNPSSPNLKEMYSTALAAHMSGKELSIYLEDEAHTCENSPSWASLGKLRHFKVL